MKIHLEDGKTPLTILAEKVELPNLKLLIEKKVRIDMKNDTDKKALLAILNEQDEAEELIKQLVEGE